MGTVIGRPIIRRKSHFGNKQFLHNACNGIASLIPVAARITLRSLAGLVRISVALTSGSPFSAATLTPQPAPLSPAPPPHSVAHLLPKLLGLIRRNVRTGDAMTDQVNAPDQKRAISLSFESDSWSRLLNLNVVRRSLLRQNDSLELPVRKTLAIE